MLIDLLITATLGLIVEFLGVYTFNRMIYATIIPYSVSLLIVMIAVRRWELKGMIIVPFLGISTILSGRLLNTTETFAVYYDWKLYISITVSFLVFIFNIYWFKLRKKKGIKEKTSAIACLCVIDIILSLLVLTLTYYMLTGEFYLLAFPVWSAFSYVILMVGSCVLFKQGVLVNVKDNFIRQNEELKFEAQDFQFCLDEEDKNSIEEKGDFKDGKVC